MSTLWIVHREERERAALARLAALEDAVAGAPTDTVFDAAAPAEVVLLGLVGLAGDWEAELEFAHRHRARLRDARWVLLGARDERDAALALFDQLAAKFLPYPPDTDSLQRRLRDARRPKPRSLSGRARREAAAERFSRWLADLEIPALLRAMDPRLAEVPLKVSGEPGTGRSVLVRYVHEFGATAEGPLVHVPCEPETRSRDIEEALALARPRGAALCVWLDEVGRLSSRVQRELREWIAAGPPPGVRAPRLRWMATHDETGPDLEPGLAHALAALEIRLPPLRERSERLATIVAETARAWAAARRESPRRFDEDALVALREYPWPGNLRELEAVLERTLASTSADPIHAHDLAHEALAPTPLDASEFGTLLPDDEEGEEVVPPAAAAVGRERRPVAEARPATGPGPPPSPALPAPTPPASSEDTSVERLAAALSQEMREPLSAIHSCARLLPARGADPEFLRHSAEALTADVQRLEEPLARLEKLARLGPPVAQKVDVPALLEALLEERREAFRAGHLLVLKELDAGRPLATGDPRHLRLAFEALLDTALASVPERGDVYLASRHHDGGVSGEPSVRVLLRFHDPEARVEAAGGSPRDRSLALVVAELLVNAQGGRFTLAASEAEERVIVVDLPAP